MVSGGQESMQGYLPGYELDPTTWAYLSSFLIIGVFFKFHRFWSVRNLDLVALIALAPGLLWVAHGQGPGGYIWLFAVGCFFLVRLLMDPLMVRRPLLEPNLNASGLAFTGIALLAFLMTNIVTGTIAPLAMRPVARDRDGRGAASPLLYAIADLSNEAPTAAEDKPQPERIRRELAQAAMVRTTAVLAHLALVIGIALIGYRHFDNVHTGVAMATLYLVLPYTAQITPRVDHVVPAALLVWAVYSYRRPELTGILIGMAAGLIGYPLFLLPLWCGFYRRRGLIRFAVGTVLGLVLLVFFLLMLVLASKLFGWSDIGSFGDRLRQMFGWATLWRAEADGFWQSHGQAFRIPVIAAFLVLCGSMALWPAQKNLGTLMSCSAAVMLGVQFWHPYQGGIYMAWYLPLLVLTIFRPNLEDRMAVTAVRDPWLPWQTSGWVSWRLQDWIPQRPEGPGARRRRTWLPWRTPRGG